MNKTASCLSNIFRLSAAYSAFPLHVFPLSSLSTPESLFLERIDVPLGPAHGNHE
jgi:hypothetical protein